MAFSPEEITQLERKLPKLLFSYAFSLTRGHREAAEDLSQTTLLKMWEKRDRFESGTSLVAWSLVILRNHFFTEQRRAWRQVQFTDPDHVTLMVESVAVDGGQHARLELKEALEIIDSLPEEQREALKMLILGYTYEDIAEATDSPPGTAKSRTSRGRTRLIQIFEGAADPEPAQKTTGKPEETTTPVSPRKPQPL